MGVYFNRKRTIGQYLGLLRYFLFTRFLKSIPYRLTAKQRKLPDFLIVGTMKGGTSSLYHWLNAHPDVKMSREQEVHFFSKYYGRGLNYYRSYFPKISEGKYTGESSPYYLFHPLAPERIKKDLPDCKIIILLRDPVYRAYSHYQMHKGIDPAHDFDEAVALEDARVMKKHGEYNSGKDGRSTSHQAYSYTARGMYFEQLERWLKYYSKNELLILKSEDLFAQPHEHLHRVQQYLGIPIHTPETLAPVNQREYQKLTKEAYDKYAVLFREDSEKLRELLGPNFSWSYEMSHL